ncbi:MAG: M23 family metallopeptidase [Gemmatimonadetes bacterium]|nr:M23 family metallopeptidase [Gemmatimonadota bacterium]
MKALRNIVFGLAGILGGAVLAGCGPDAASSSDLPRSSVAVEVAPPAAAAPATPVLRHASRAIGRGESLDWVLASLDLAPAERLLAIDALKSEVDLRRVMPGETVDVAREEGGLLREVALQRDRLERVVARWLDEQASPVVEVERREPVCHLRRIEGTLDSSLFESVVAAGGDANLTMRFADLLAWQVDFLTDPRAGDRFTIVVREEWLDGECLGFGKILAAEYQGAEASSRAIRYVDENGVLDWYDDTGRSVRRAFLKSPLEYRRISSRFSNGRRHPILKVVRPHHGVDYAAPTGTPVSALGDGKVIFAGRKGGYGNYIEVRHSSTYTTCYGHLARFAKGVRVGARVGQGDVIGYVGSTGLSTGPHLDFRVKKNGGFVDPLRLDAPPGREISADGMARFARYRDRTRSLERSIALGESLPEIEAWARLGWLGGAEDVMATEGEGALILAGSAAP